MTSMKKRIAATLTATILATELIVPAVAEAPAIRVSSYKGNTLKVGERSGLIIGPSDTDYAVTTSALDTVAVEHVKTLSTIIGHVSSATTLNIYTHITGEMQRNAARNIDQGIAGVEVQEQDETEREETAPSVQFTPYRPPHRRPGTGCISQINDHLWEGRYSPKWIDGKKHARNIYAHTREECEEKLAVLIVQMKRELAELKAAQTAGAPSRH